MRALSIRGAGAVLIQALRTERKLDPWLNALLSRRPKSVAIVALANEIARTVWALMAHRGEFDQRWNESAAALPAAT